MSSLYAALKTLHVGCVATSFALFVLRGIGMLHFPARLAQRWLRIVPHMVDTVLLASAIGLAAMLGIDPATRGWLAAKVVGLLVYIVLGTIALKRGRTRSIRLAAFIGALATFGYIVSVAIAKTPEGFLAWL